MMLEVRTKPRLGREQESLHNNDRPVWNFDEGGSIILSVSHANARIVGRVALVQGGWVARSVFGVVLDTNGIKVQTTKRGAVVALLDRVIRAPLDRARLLTDFDIFEAGFVGRALMPEQVARLAAIHSHCRPVEDGETACPPSGTQGPGDSADDGHEAQGRSRYGEHGQER
ncbi:MAG: hypothetical protein Q8J92_02660 [Parvibaculum sp.]|nr:hypothetical protein [Parvibaculum sp.]